MVKRLTAVLLLAVLAASALSACTDKNEAAPHEGALTYADYIGANKTFAAQLGDIYGEVARDVFKAGEIHEFVLAPDMAEAVRMGKADAAITDDAFVNQIKNSGLYPNLDYLPVPEELFVNRASNVFHTPELRDKFNVWLDMITKDGTFDEIYNRWISGSLPDEEDIPRFEPSGENGTLVAANTGNFPPFSYIDSNNKQVGFDAEITERFAEYMGMKVEYAIMSYDAIIPYIISGKADMSACSFTVTGERSESVIFGAEFTKARAVLIVPKNAAGGTVNAPLTFTDFKGKRIGAVTGNLSGEVISAHIGTPAYYSEQSAGIEDVRKGRIDGFMTDYSILRVIAASPGFEDTYVVPVPAEIFSGPIGAFSANQEMMTRFNVFLSQIKDDGTLADMHDRWIENVPDSDTAMPDITTTGENGTLKVATSGLQLPFSYFGADNELKGYSIELAIRFAAHEGMKVELEPMDFTALIPYVAGGKADVGFDAVTITEERARSVHFSDSIYDDVLGIITLKTSGAAAHYADFTGKRFAVMAGSVFDEIADRVWDASEKLYFNNVIDELQAVRQGKADATLLDDVVAMVNLSGGNFSDLRVMEVPLEELNFEYAVFSGKREVIDKYNLFLREIKENGVYDDMARRWFADFDLAKKMPEFELSGKNGTLNVAINASYPPFVYLGENGTWSGFDIEQFYRFAQFLDMDISFSDMEFGALLPYTVSGKSDISSSIYVTEERRQSVIFGDVDYVSKTVLVYKDDAVQAQEDGGFAEWLKTGIERNLLTDNRWEMIVNGLGVTMTIALMAQLFGTVFGCFVCWLLTRKNKLVRWLGNFYCGLIHGTPVVVLLMITYYIIFGNAAVSNVLIAIAAFTMVTGAGIAQNLKGAIETVDPVEIEAARSIGFPAFKAFRAVTLPQAVRRVLPSYTNGFVELVKATAIVGYIAIQDLTRAGDIIRSRTYDAYFPLLFVAIIYLIVTTACVQIFKLAVKKINGGEAK